MRQPNALLAYRGGTMRFRLEYVLVAILLIIIVFLIEWLLRT